MEVLKTITADRSEEEQRKLLRDNATTFYGLELPPKNDKLV